MTIVSIINSSINNLIVYRFIFKTPFKVKGADNIIIMQIFSVKNGDSIHREGNRIPCYEKLTRHEVVVPPGACILGCPHPILNIRLVVALCLCGPHCLLKGGL